MSGDMKDMVFAAGVFVAAALIIITLVVSGTLLFNLYTDMMEEALAFMFAFLSIVIPAMVAGFALSSRKGW